MRSWTLVPALLVVTFEGPDRFTQVRTLKANPQKVLRVCHDGRKK